MLFLWSKAKTPDVAVKSVPESQKHFKMVINAAGKPSTTKEVTVPIRGVDF